MIGSTTYGPAGLTTATSGQVLGADPLSQLMQGFIAKRIYDAQAAAPASVQAPEVAPVDPYEGMMKQIALDRARFAKEQEQERARREQQKEAEAATERKRASDRAQADYNEMHRGPALKPLSGLVSYGSQGPAYTMDTLSMTPMQRKLFLPETSGQQFSPEEAATAKAKLGADASWQDRWNTQGMGYGWDSDLPGLQASRAEFTARQRRGQQG